MTSIALLPYCEELGCEARTSDGVELDVVAALIWLPLTRRRHRSALLARACINWLASVALSKFVASMTVETLIIERAQQNRMLAHALGLLAPAWDVSVLSAEIVCLEESVSQRRDHGAAFMTDIRRCRQSFQGTTAGQALPLASNAERSCRVSPPP